MVFKINKKRPKDSWTQLPELLLTKYLARGGSEPGQNEMVDTNESILKILNVVEIESKKSTPELRSRFF